MTSFRMLELLSLLSRRRRWCCHVGVLAGQGLLANDGQVLMKLEKMCRHWLGQQENSVQHVAVPVARVLASVTAL